MIGDRDEKVAEGNLHSELDVAGYGDASESYVALMTPGSMEGKARISWRIARARA
jgi:hypothetical protein